MITNEREYLVTQALIRQFEETLKDEDGEQNIPPEERKLLRAGVGDQLEQLRKQVSEYEALGDGRKTEFEVDFMNLADVLIYLRHAGKISQQELAEKLGVKQQQIQRYEAKEYEQASYARLKEIVWALGANIRMHVALPSTVTQQTERLVQEWVVTPESLIGDTFQADRSYLSVPIDQTSRNIKIAFASADTLSPIESSVERVLIGAAT